jgi:hypothetical protein
MYNNPVSNALFIRCQNKTPRKRRVLGLLVKLRSLERGAMKSALLFDSLLFVYSSFFNVQWHQKCLMDDSSVERK